LDGNLSSAINDYHRARQRAIIHDLLDRFTGGRKDLIPYEEVVKRLHAQPGVERGIREIPVEAIVGSVNRYTDFTRDFLPRSRVIPERWARVEVIVNRQSRVPPIEVYQIGEVYFVQDGNHRVSVSRQLGVKSITALVTEIHTHIPLLPTDSPDELILKSEYAGFLHRTELDESRPNARLEVTVPGRYAQLEEMIAVHQFYINSGKDAPVSYEQAAADWYDHWYLPLVEIIQAQGILQEFPGRTETDLVLWISEHRLLLEKEMASRVRPEDAARDLAEHFSKRPRRLAARIAAKIKQKWLPERLKSGPRPGQWRMERGLTGQPEALFDEILVPFKGGKSSWAALDQAILIAQREQGHIKGLHLRDSRQPEEDAFVELDQQFLERCQDAGVDCMLTSAAGEPNDMICQRARWNDLIVMSLEHPPAEELSSSPDHGFQRVVQTCPRPVLAVPGQPSPITRILLAYDSSPKASEALYITMYLAGKWNLPVAVVSVNQEHLHAGESLIRAGAYLEGYGVEPELIYKEGDAAGQILQAATSFGADLILAGGYGKAQRGAAGSSITALLRQTTIPVLICR
jgi:nucleotide-binding universal stress UspA family protein